VVSCAFSPLACGLPATVMGMSEYEQDPSANTGRFRAFAERSDDEVRRARRPAVSPAALVIVAVLVIAVIIVIVAVA